jgi:hypothetical protein
MRSARRFLLAGAAIALLAGVAACTGSQPARLTPQAAPSGSPATVANAEPVVTGPVHPRPDGVLFGAWVKPPGGLTQSERVEAVRGLERTIGRPLDIVNTYRRFDQRFPTASDVAFADAGATLMVSWATGDTRQIAAGRQDKQLVEWARRFASFRHPILLRVRWEMDRPNLAAAMWSGADYIAAWRHIRAVFAAQHARNVAWVWCPTIAGFASGTAPAFYPGDREVDWTCVDVYAGSRLRPMSELLQPFLTWAAAHPKPIIIGEYGVAARWGSADRVAWLQAASDDFRVNPQIKAVSYFDSNPDGAPPSQQFELVGDPELTSAFAEMARTPYFDPRGHTTGE